MKYKANTMWTKNSINDLFKKILFKYSELDYKNQQEKNFFLKKYSSNNIIEIF